jgi:lactate permease
MDATLGLAFARTGIFYPFFGTLIGWLGTASTGSDTSSNVLFGSLQKLTAQQLGISPYLMASANSTGGVMGKMVAPQSIVVATTATNTYGTEGTILRFVLLHSIALACLMGLLVSLMGILARTQSSGAPLGSFSKQYSQIAQIVPRRPRYDRVSQHRQQ